LKGFNDNRDDIMSQLSHLVPVKPVDKKETKLVLLRFVHIFIMKTFSIGCYTF